MPLHFVNPTSGKRRRKVRGSVRVKLRKAKRNRSAKHAGFAKRMARARRRKAKLLGNPASKKRKGHKSKKRSTKIMAKKKRARGRKAKRSKKSYRRAAKLGARRRKAAAVAKPARKRKRKGSGKKRGRGRKRSKAKRSRARRTKSRRKGRKRGRRTAARLGHARRKRRAKAIVVYGPRKSQRGRATLRANPSRRRRRKARRSSGRSYRRSSRRRGRRRSARRYSRRHGRSHYRRNPGAMLKDLAKKAIPVVLSIIGAKFVSAKIAPKLPGISSLGKFAAPAVAIGTVVLAHFATKKVGFLAKRRDAIMMGSSIVAVQEILAAIVPDSVKTMLGMGGMGDYIAVGMSDYIAVDGTPIDDTMTLSDYISVGALEQEMGLDQELGFTAELGAWQTGQNRLGGMSQGSMLAPVPNRPMLSAVPARSFTEEVPGMTAGYDNPDDLYEGIFAGSALR